ncbi:MAG: hypothetical protein ABR975_07310 [Vulcanimicrobiaceae bacterium]|jgi:hypothetical protein
MYNTDEIVTIVASFPTREAASKTAHALHDDGAHTWIGVTQNGVTEKRRSPVARWFHRDSDRTLYDLLREHGVDEEDARLVDQTIVEGDAVLVAEGTDPLKIEREVLARGGTVRSALVEEYDEPNDPLANARMVAAERHPAPIDLEPKDRIEVVREEFFVRRGA